MRYLVGILLAVTIFPACVMFPSAKISEHHDEFSGDTSVVMERNVLAGGIGLSSNAQVALNPVRTQGEKDPRPSYFLMVEYIGYGTGWCFIRSGESLHLLIDGERVHLSGEGSSGSRGVGAIADSSACHEKALFEADEQLIRRLATATDVRVKIDGDDLNLERSFSEKNFKNFRLFVSAYLDKAPVKTN